MNFPVLVGSLLLLTGTQVPLQVKQDHVLPVFGCGTGCSVETEQLTYPEIMDDGWIRIKVIQRAWIRILMKNGQHKEISGAEGGYGPDAVLWLFADCAGERFGISRTPNRSDGRDVDVFYREGDAAGEPIHQTVAGNPFMRWAKLCPAEAKEGLEWIRNGAY